MCIRDSFRSRQAKRGGRFRRPGPQEKWQQQAQQYHSQKERFMKVSMTVNGKPVSAEVEARTLLVTFIREHLRLTGTHVGCDTSQCGACTIHMNGQAVHSCNILAMQAEGADILTIEGLAEADGTLHPMQEAFREHHGLQCGFCTPGMVMSAVDLVKNHPNPSEETIRAELDGNLCRCTGYHNIVNGQPMKEPAHPCLAQGKVCHVGDQVAVVIAETYNQARDAAELVEVDYEVLPAVVDVVSALKKGAPTIHDAAPGNTCYVWALGDQGAVDKAMASAAHVTKLEFVNNRLIPNAIEPRAVNASYTRHDESLSLIHI